MKTRKIVIITMVIASFVILAFTFFSYSIANKNAKEITLPISNYVESDSNLYFGRILGPNEIKLAWRFSYSYPYELDAEFNLFFTLNGKLILPTNPGYLIERLNNNILPENWIKLPEARLKDLKIKLQENNWPKNYINNSNFIVFEPGCLLTFNTIFPSGADWIENVLVKQLKQYGVDIASISQNGLTLLINGKKYQLIGEKYKEEFNDYIKTGKKLEIDENRANEIAAEGSFDLINSLLSSAKSAYKLYALRDGSYFFGVFLKGTEFQDIKKESLYSEYYQPFIPKTH